ncbi:ArnT family glycosyltransferase [Paenibacillus sp. UNC451MF]|uniref:ArnT family glycosyltransferase n=1 Tax=Paenibacillus sp. UNC451MF TaxID=1449063 RepID=UPI001E2931E7|nr:phospholipid carrier-dependent glycosyltransferase [Paenibacillus sp. UNC451MF]
MTEHILIMKTYHKGYVILLILILIAALRVPSLANSPYEYDSWRQSDTESIAINFLENRFNLMYPQLNYDGPMPNYVQLEFQITTWIIAVMYNLFGYHYELARMVPLSFFIGSAYFLYLIAKRFYQMPTAWIATLMYGILPLHILYSRAIMPESTALFFMVGAFYLFVRWMDQQRFWILFAAGCFTALAISQKIPAVFVGIPMIWMAVKEYGLRCIVKWELWLFALISLLPPYLYFQWLSTIAEFPFVTGIATKHIIPSLFTSIASTEALQFFVVQLPKAFTWYGIVLFIIGLVTIHWKKEYPIGVWAIAMVVELITIVATIKFDYYLILIGPLVALLGAVTLGSFWSKLPGKLAAVIVIVLISIQSYQLASPLLREQHTVLLRQAEVVQAYTLNNDLIVVGTDDPSLLNASHRKGWRVGNTIPKDTIAELQYFVKMGAKYFVPLQGHIDGDDGSLQNYLNERYTLIDIKGGYSIYKLQ